jgi:hypothetical protein
MDNIAKLLIISGIILVLAGLVFVIFSKVTFLGKLPGDIHIQKGNFSFYFPVASCLLVSVLISFIILVVRLIK